MICKDYKFINPYPTTFSCPEMLSAFMSAAYIQFSQDLIMEANNTNHDQNAPSEIMFAIQATDKQMIKVGVLWVNVIASFQAAQYVLQVIIGPVKLKNLA